MDYKIEQDGMLWRARLDAPRRMLRTNWRHAPLVGEETRDEHGKVRERHVDGHRFVALTIAAKDELLRAERALRNGRPVPMHVHVYECATLGVLPAEVRDRLNNRRKLRAKPQRRAMDRPSPFERTVDAALAAERAAWGRPKMVDERGTVLASTAPKFTLH